MPMQPRPTAKTSGPPRPSFRKACGWAVIAIPLLTGQPLRLRFKVAGHTDVEPAMDLSGQIKEFDSHGSSPLEVPGSSQGDTISAAPGWDIVHLADRFQYLSFNIS